MTIYYNLTFLLLAGEMITFCLLVAPLPQRARKGIFNFLLKNTIVAKLAYALKISFIFVAILFFDAVQRMWKVTTEAELAKQSHPGSTHAQTENSMAAKKFYAQRNTYLTGFTLFLSLVLTATFYIILDLIKVQEENQKLNSESGPLKKENQKLCASVERQLEELEELKKRMSAKERDFEILKSQALSQAAEYNRLADRYNEATGARKSNKKSD